MTSPWRESARAAERKYCNSVPRPRSYLIAAVFVFVFVFVFVRVIVAVRVRVHACAETRHAQKRHATDPLNGRYTAMLDYERLDVYQCALRFAALSFQMLEGMPRGHSELSDQLRRATISIPLNIAEGAGRPTERDRLRYHAIARGSAMECSAVVDLLRL